MSGVAVGFGLRRRGWFNAGQVLQYLRHPAPAGEGVVGTDAAGVIFASTNGEELACRGCGLAGNFTLIVGIATPTGHGAVQPNTAGVAPPETDRLKLAFRWRRYAIVIGAGASYRAIGAYAAVIVVGAETLNADRLKSAGQGMGKAQQSRVSSGRIPQWLPLPPP